MFIKSSESAGVSHILHHAKNSAVSALLGVFSLERSMSTKKSVLGLDMKKQLGRTVLSHLEAERCRDKGFWVGYQGKESDCPFLCVNKVREYKVGFGLGVQALEQKKREQEAPKRTGSFLAKEIVGW